MSDPTGCATLIKEDEIPKGISEKISLEILVLKDSPQIEPENAPRAGKLTEGLTNFALKDGNLI